MSIVVSLLSKKMSLDALLVPVTSAEAKKSLGKHAAATVREHIADTSTLFAAYQFTGKAGEVCAHVTDNGMRCVFVGLGDLAKSGDENRETLRRALGSGYSALQRLNVKTIGLVLPTVKPFGVTRSVLVEQVATLLHVASYRLVAFKKDKKTWQPTFALLDGTADDKKALETGTIIGQAMNETRTLADTPPNHMKPVDMANYAKKMAKEQGLKFSSFGQEKAKDLGMGCYYSVAKGSINEGQFVTLEYAPKAKNVPTIALVGKGVCFDTGGISLKPASYMSGMKYDMSGAAAVYGAMQVIAQLKPNVRVIGVTPLVENMPSDRASKQDDVVTAMNGLTVEIENTDAEGRLILSDALTYVQKKYKPETMIDVATLTGACMHALGHFYAGMMTRDDKLSEQLSRIGSFVGDKLWRLPLSDEYKPALDSPVADVANCGTPTYKAGATTAALFLEHFVEKGVRWAHLDIAGTDSKIPGTTYLGRGATGTGVRIFVELVRQLSK